MDKPVTARVRVIPITKKMKERVKAHGDMWLTDTVDIKPGQRISIETIVNVYKVDDKMYPYSRWVTVGVDCNLELLLFTAKKIKFTQDGKELKMYEGEFSDKVEPIKVISSKILTADRAYLKIDGRVVATFKNFKIEPTAISEPMPNAGPKKITIKARLLKGPKEKP